MDHRLVAELSIAGSVLDVLGALYLAYDLLGGRHGPLRTLTRSVTYGLFFGMGVWIPLGAFFALVTAVGMGITLGIEFSEASRGRMPPSWRLIVVSSLIRGAALGLGAGVLISREFGLCFGLLAFAGQLFAYRVGFGPATAYAADRKPRLTRRHLLGALNRTIGYILAGLVSGAITHSGRQALGFSVSIGLAIGLMSAILALAVPFVEFWADNLPERRLGALGAGMVVTGFVLQSIQYWAVLLNVPVR
jgi:branched-subunit amino acid transport protein